MPYRRRAVGAEISDAGVHFRVWAPSASRIAVVTENPEAETALDEESKGYFSGYVATARAGTRYRFRIDGARETYPDPASRFQPEGPHGPSVVVDAREYRWRDQSWK